MDRPMRESSSAARARVAPESMAPNRCGSRPSRMFSATERFGQRFTSWYTVATPAVWASPGPEKRTAVPSSRVVPLVAE